MKEPSYTPDMAEIIDDAADLLAEELGCSRGMALRVLERDARRAEESEVDKCARLAVQLRIVLAELLRPGNGLRVRLWALAFASGLAQHFGAACMAAKAAELGVGRAAVSHSAGLWKRRLGLTDTTFTRDAETAERSRVARREVIARQKPNDLNKHV